MVRHFLVQIEGDNDYVELEKTVVIQGHYGGDMEGETWVTVYMDELDAEEMVKNFCQDCKNEFYTFTDEAKICPFCGSKRLDKQ